MGRTLKTANQIVLDEQKEFKQFRRALRRLDQHSFDKLFTYAKQHTAAISQTSHALPFETILLAINLELLKEIEQLKQKINV
ncbi:MAG: hypothetical protein AAF490_02410 [Chloroflexota bacterium]